MSHDDWTPERGLRRAIRNTLIATVVIGAVLWPVACYTPLLMMNLLLRCFLGLLLAWTMLAVAQRSAGFCGVWVTTVAIAGVVLILLSHHAAWALHGVPSRNGVVIGMVWLHPLALLVTNATALIGVGGATLICHRNGADLEPLLDLLTRNVRGG